jgi:TolB protein
MRVIQRHFPVCLAIAMLATSAAAQDTTRGVRLGLTYDANGKPGVAIMQAFGTNGDSVRAILTRDLEFSDRMSTIALDSAPVGALNYDIYSKLNAAAIVQASVTPSGSLHIALHEVSQKRVLSVIDMPLPSPAFSPEWRRVVHVAADSLEFFILGSKGISSTRVLFAGARDGRIWSVDFDGGGMRAITGDEGALSPSWSADGKQIAYGTIRVGEVAPRIVVRDIESGKMWTTRAASMNSQPAFSPDGSTLVFSAGSEGTSLFSVKPWTTESPQRLTPPSGKSNQSPSFSPDGRTIAFMSDRVGHPEVYIMDADGSNAYLLTDTGFGDKLERSNPSWSPNGRVIAYQSRVNDSYQIMTISVTDRSVVQRTSEGVNEDPSWAPDGRHLVFASTRSGTNQLWILDTETGVARQLTKFAGKLQNPSWSPKLEFKP